MQCDIQNINELQQSINKVCNTYGPITTLINNAGRDTRHTLESLSIEAWNTMQNTNLRPYFFSSQAVLPGMKKLGGGFYYQSMVK